MNNKIKVIADAMEFEFAKTGVISQNKLHGEVNKFADILEQLVVEKINELGYVNFSEEMEKRFTEIFNDLVGKFERIVVSATEVAEENFQKGMIAMEGVSIETAIKTVLNQLVNEAGIEEIWPVPLLVGNKFFVE
jgi:hypothetical protein